MCKVVLHTHDCQIRKGLPEDLCRRICRVKVFWLSVHEFDVGEARPARQVRMRDTLLSASNTHVNHVEVLSPTKKTAAVEERRGEERKRRCLTSLIVDLRQATLALHPGFISDKHDLLVVFGGSDTKARQGVTNLWLA